MRPSSSFGSYSGLDGSGVGIAVLDSGVMAAHQHMNNASGVSRVTRQIDLVEHGVVTGRVDASEHAALHLERDRLRLEVLQRDAAHCRPLT